MALFSSFFWISYHEAQFKQGFLIQYLNNKYSYLEYSSQLIFETPQQLLPQLQKQRVLKALMDKQNEINVFPDFKGILSGFIGVVCLYGILYFLNFPTFQMLQPKSTQVSVTPVLPASLEAKIPAINAFTITVQTPAYTHLGTQYSKELSLQAPEKSIVSWQCELGKSVEQFEVIWNGKDTAVISSKSEIYTWQLPLNNSLFYQFRYGNGKEWFVSPVYTIHAIKDQSPVITVQNPAPYTLVLYGKKPEINVDVQINDDYGLVQAQLIATVSRGSGESVKFKESKLPFDEKVAGKKQAQLHKNIDFNKLQMEPGDELYFYAEATDEANPANRSRSEMYFVQYEDTTSQKLTTMAGISLDNMPAYFRSQRQIIIDTEKLIAEKKSLSNENFQKRSNELGIDQKVLRLRYGQFLGEEFETNIGANPNHSHEKKSKQEQGNAVFKNLLGSKTKDPASRTIISDSIVKHYNPADHQKEHEQEKILEQLHNHETSRNPTQVNFGVAGDMLREYEHRHDIEESATFFDETMKAQLKAALAQMWESELRLRTMRPEEALSYEYKALELIKALQQKSRVYVEKTGFKPPVLKPAEKRLTGELDDIRNPKRIWNEEAIEKLYPNLRKAISILEKIRQTPDFTINATDKTILEKAGNELAGIILKQPGIRISVLNDLRQIISGKGLNEITLYKVQQQLAGILPSENHRPGTVHLESEPELDIFINELNR
jgi:hypothetical protein